MKTLKPILLKILLFVGIIAFCAACSRGSGCPAKNFQVSTETI